jgi:methyl-accepting chemotaxis protein
MKGTVPNCMQSLVIHRFGESQWKRSLAAAGLAASTDYSAQSNVDDGEVLALIRGIGEANSLAPAEVMQAFGEYWSSVYAPVIYQSFYEAPKSTREFLLGLDAMHIALTRILKDVQLPRFTYEWQGENHLVMHYRSTRNMVGLMPGMVTGLGIHFGDAPKVWLEGNAVHVVFNDESISPEGMES